MDQSYDVIIIGAGPAGLTAGLYAGRARMRTLIIEQAKEGGQIGQTAEIENYPGSISHESGPSLIDRMTEQAKHFGVELVYDTVEAVDLEGTVKTIKGFESTYTGKTVIIAAGAKPITIGCQGEREMIGKGVSYCATCDGAFFQELEVFVVGGGDSAVEEAIYLTKFARKVTIVHRRGELRAAKSIQEKAFSNPKINFLWDTVVKELAGPEGILSEMTVENVKTGEQTLLKAAEEDGLFGVFVFIGYKPNSNLFEGKVEMENNYIKTDRDQRTNVPGVFAAGDICVKNLRQVVTATADGAIAAVQAEKYIEHMLEA